MTSVKYQYDDLMNPVIQALKLLGGSGTNGEINDKVAEIVNIPTAQLEILHNPEKGGMTENRVPPDVDKNIPEKIWRYRKLHARCLVPGTAESASGGGGGG